MGQQSRTWLPANDTRMSKFLDIATLLKAIGEDDSTESFIDELLERDESGEYQIMATYRELAAELGKAQLAIEEAKELKEPIHVSHVSRF